MPMRQRLDPESAPVLMRTRRASEPVSSDWALAGELDWLSSGVVTRLSILHGAPVWNVMMLGGIVACRCVDR